MRSLLAYLLAVAVAVVGLGLGFPELWQSDAADAVSAERSAAAPPVVVTTVRPAPFVDRLHALGTVLANESVELTANAADHVTALHFTDGQEVEGGDLLVELNAAEERARLAEARALLADRETTHDRASTLVERQISAESDLDTAQAQLLAAEARVASLEAQIADREVRAPFAGTLGLRRISAGAYLGPETVITTLDDLSVVKVDFTIPETWLGQVGLGNRVVGRSDAYPEREFPGEIAAIDTRLDAGTRSATLRAVVPNPERLLRPGMLLKIAIDRGEDAVLQVPEAALRQEEQRHFVYRIDAEGSADLVEVGIGRRRVGAVEITSGLAEGDRVIVKGTERLQPGIPVQVVDEAQG